MSNSSIEGVFLYNSDPVRFRGVEEALQHACRTNVSYYYQELATGEQSLTPVIHQGARFAETGREGVYRQLSGIVLLSPAHTVGHPRAGPRRAGDSAHV